MSFDNYVTEYRFFRLNEAEFPWLHRLNRFSVANFGKGWGVAFDSLQLNLTTNDFDYVPMPSSRDASFYEEHRWPTHIEATKAMLLKIRSYFDPKTRDITFLRAPEDEKTKFLILLDALEKELELEQDK